MVKDGSWSCRPVITLAGIPAAMLQNKANETIKKHLSLQKKIH